MLSSAAGADRDCYSAALIQALDQIGQQLELWEQEFIVSVTEQFFELGYELSPKQLLKLEEVWRRHSCKLLLMRSGDETRSRKA